MSKPKTVHYQVKRLRRWMTPAGLVVARREEAACGRQGVKLTEDANHPDLCGSCKKTNHWHLYMTRNHARP